MQSTLMAITAALMWTSAAGWAANGQWASVIVFCGFGLGYLGLALQFLR